MIVEIIVALLMLYLLTFPIVFAGLILILDFGKDCGSLSCNLMRLIIRVYSFNFIKLKKVI